MHAGVVQKIYAAFLKHCSNLFFCSLQNKLPFAPNPRHHPNLSNAPMDGGDSREMSERPPLKPLEEVTCFKVYFLTSPFVVVIHL